MNGIRFARGLLYLATICTIFALGACTTISPPAPKPEPVAPLPPVANSSIAIPINVDTVALGHELETLMSTEHGPNGIYWVSGDHISGNADLEMGVNRNGPVTVTTDGGCLNISVPLEINSGRIDYTVSIGFLHPHKVFSFGGAANVKARACVGVTNDWHITSTVVPNFDWTANPTLSFNVPILGTITIGIRDRVTPKLQAKLPMVQQKIQDKLAAIDLSPKMAKAWEGIQKPLQLSASPNVTASVDVAGVGLGPMTSSGTDLVIRPSIVAKLSAHLGAPAVVAPAKPLPPNSGQTAADGFNLAVRADAPFSDMNRELTDRVVNKELEFGGGKHVKLTDVSLSSLGDKILIRASFKAKLGSFPIDNVEGWLYLVGKPKYDDVARVLSVKEIYFDGGTDSALVNAGAVILKPIIIERLTKAAVFDLSKTIDPVKTKVLAGIQAKELRPGVTLNVNVSTFDVSTLYVDAAGVGIFTNARGIATLAVGNVLP